ncbi:MAG: LAGLIDADG family homing endonuclease [Candidatus Kaiserbacteria bacterium]|nr:LAGLIDADG family homing endonuclease [Candidatus Kaiserbacteria bacterium]
MPIPRTLDQDFFKTWSPEMAYVLGFFAADGTMIANKRGAHFIEFHITDKHLLFQIRALLGSNHKIATRIEHNPRHKTGYRLQIGSKEIFNDLLRLRMTPAKSLTLRLPRISKTLQKDFVRGYFDGDGCVYFAFLKCADRKKPRPVFQSIFTCGSRLFLEELLRLLRRHGISRGTIRTKKHGFDLLLSYRDSLALFHLMYDTVSATGLFLPRKYKIFRKAIKTLYPNAVVV